jgi:hypothetical protein
VPHLALHDIDANKPGGSIKIRVKTYVHSLKLHEERLDDLSRKKLELARKLDEKRFELLSMKQRQLAERKVNDPALQVQLDALAEKLRSYQAPAAVAEEPSTKSDLIRLRRKGAAAENASV